MFVQNALFGTDSLQTSKARPRRGPRGIVVRCQASLSGTSRVGNGPQPRPVAVVTGASTGIGRTIAQRLDTEGWEVYAGVRRTEDGDAIRAGGHPSIKSILIDVTSDSSVKEAATTVARDLGDSRGVSALINNAGKVILAPVEFMPLDVFEDQLQVNLVGAMRVTQCFLPLVRRRAGASGSGDSGGVTSSSSPSSPSSSSSSLSLGGGGQGGMGGGDDWSLLGRLARGPGRIINMSSQSGSLAYPLFAGYAASKFGMEALSDCLRYELDGQGIKTILIKPGPIRTPIWDKGFDASSKVLDLLPEEGRRLYGDLVEKMIGLTKSAAAKSLEPEEVADIVMLALTTPNPRPRYLLGRSATLQVVAHRFLPSRVWDRIVLAAIDKAPK